mmetsp:Transcript_17172/g.60302  ORF Transcript_17172/g.60302 Transcript_17172/m.60302 type:complete len:314 (+) Transcript_17172:452-1393(+)
MHLRKEMSARSASSVYGGTGAFMSGVTVSSSGLGFHGSNNAVASMRSASVTTSGSNFQVSKKASPMFLLAAPPPCTTRPCTTSAMRLTNSITSCCRHSVVSVNLRISQKPKMALTCLPGASGLSSADSLRLPAMMAAPASPKPTRSSPPIFLIVPSSSVVSMPSLKSFELSASSGASGFCEIIVTTLTIFSTGASTSVCASREKSMEAVPSTMMTKVVKMMDHTAVSSSTCFLLNHSSVLYVAPRTSASARILLISVVRRSSITSAWLMQAPVMSVPLEHRYSSSDSPVGWSSSSSTCDASTSRSTDMRYASA